MRRIISILFCLTMIVSMLCVGTSAAEGTAINSASDFAKMEPDGKYYLNAEPHDHNYIRKGIQRGL